RASRWAVGGGRFDFPKTTPETTMRQGNQANPALARAGAPVETSRPGERPRRAGRSDEGGEGGSGRSWLGAPKAAGRIGRAAVGLLGGGRRLLWAWRARKAVARLEEPDVAPEQIEAVAEFGRAGAWELLRIFSATDSEPRRLAAGRALARLWREDQ